MPEPVLPPARHGQSDVTARSALAAFRLILVGVLASVFLVRWIYPGTATTHRRATPMPVYPSSRSHADPAADKPILLPARHEQSDVTARSALIAFPLILVGLLVSVFLVRWIYPGTATDHRLAGPMPVYPSPRLQADPAADMAKFRSEELARLNSAGWDDKAKGIGHIPIDDAMRRIAASGIPDWPK